MESWGRKIRLRTRIWRGFKYPLLLVSERTLVVIAILLVLAVSTAFAVLMMRKDAIQARQINFYEHPATTPAA